MSKVLKLELAKRLNDLGLLDDIETEYIFTKRDIWFWNIDYDIIEWKYFKLNDWDIKTLTLEEAKKIMKLDTLPEYARNYITTLYIQWFNNWKTLLEAIEKMLEYLIDNNLLTK